MWWVGRVIMYSPAQHHRGSLCRPQEDVRGQHPVPKTQEPGKGDCDPRHVLQHRARGQIAGKRRQAHTGPNRDTCSIAGAFHHALPSGASAPCLGFGGFYELWRIDGATLLASTGSGTNYAFGILAHGTAFFITRTHPCLANRCGSVLRKLCCPDAAMCMLWDLICINISRRQSQEGPHDASSQKTSLPYGRPSGSMAGPPPYRFSVPCPQAGGKE